MELIFTHPNRMTVPGPKLTVAGVLEGAARAQSENSTRNSVLAAANDLSDLGRSSFSLDDLIAGVLAKRPDRTRSTIKTAIRRAVGGEFAARRLVRVKKGEYAMVGLDEQAPASGPTLREALLRGLETSAVGSVFSMAQLCSLVSGRRWDDGAVREIVATELNRPFRGEPRRLERIRRGHYLWLG
ncbi:MAG: hypothetical protein ACHQNA_02840 [Acidimicrobiales bacterium]